MFQVGPAGFEPAKPCTPNRQSSDVRKNDRRSDVSENLRRSIQAELRRSDLYQSRAGGIRTHDIRLLKHVLQLGSRLLCQNATSHPVRGRVLDQSINAT